MRSGCSTSPDRLTFDPAELAAALRQVTCWSQPSTWQATGVHHGMSRASADPELWGWVLDRFAPVHTASLHRIAPGGFIIPHIDRGPWFERWHLPIITAGAWIGSRQPVAGEPFQIAHWVPHDVWNPTDQARVHLVIDRDIPIDRPTSPFQTFQVPDRWAFLVDQAKEN